MYKNILACFTIIYGVSGAAVMSADQIVKLSIERSMSPWLGMTGTAQEESDAKIVHALDLGTPGYTFFVHCDKYKINNKNLIGKNSARKIVAVEKTFFSQLKRADATRIKKNDRENIGTFSVQYFKEISSRNLALFLLDSQVIITWWHIGSTLELVKEDTVSDIHLFRFKGEHVYFTNNKNTDPLDFSILINTKTGEMSIAGN